MNSLDWNKYTNDCCLAEEKYIESVAFDKSHGFSGCCDPTDKKSCCGGPSQALVFDPVTLICKEDCPCEGCCDYNCCDELDFFLHKAYEEMYSSEYGSFLEFYNNWYHEFYSWWYTGDLKKSTQ